jgi:competence protein ComEC
MNGFIHRTPFFRLFLALALGILFASWVEVPLMWLIICACLSVGCVVCSFFISDVTRQFSKRWLFGVGALLLLMCVGAWQFQQATRQSLFPCDGTTRTYLVEVNDAPIEKSKSTLYNVRVLRYYDGQRSYDIDKKALLYLPKDTIGNRCDFGDQLLVHTAFSLPHATGNPEEFDFGRYLQQHGIAATGYVASGSYMCVKKGGAFSLRAVSSHARQRLLTVYRQYHITGDEFAVVAALMLGYNDALTRELMDSYSVTGAMHILSVSGLHVAILCAILYFLLSFMDKRRGLLIAKHLIVISLLWSFAFLTGLSPAVVRSALMFSLIAFGFVFLRKPQIYNTVFFSAFAMLIYDPNYLFDVGFQLSYLAVISIVYFEPRFKKMVSIKFKPIRWLWELLCVSMAAQLGTMFLGLFYFHRFANYFWLSNMVVVPLSGFIMYAAMALLIVSAVPVVGQVVAFVLKWLLIVMNGGVKFIEHLPFAVSAMWIDRYQLMLSAAFIIFITAYFSNKKYPMLFVGLMCAMLFLVDDVLRSYESSSCREMVVLADAKHTHVQFSMGNKAFAITSDSSKLKQLLSVYLIKNQIRLSHFTTENAVSFCGKHCLVTNDTLFRQKIADNVLTVDYLIVGNKTRITMEKLLHFVAPKMVIIDHTISPWYSKKIKSECDSLNIACVDTKESGAVRISFPWKSLDNQ